MTTCTPRPPRTRFHEPENATARKILDRILRAPTTTPKLNDLVATLAATEAEVRAAMKCLASKGLIESWDDGGVVVLLSERGARMFGVELSPDGRRWIRGCLRCKSADNGR